MTTHFHSFPHLMYSVYIGIRDFAHKEYIPETLWANQKVWCVCVFRVE